MRRASPPGFNLEENEREVAGAPDSRPPRASFPNKGMPKWKPPLGAARGAQTSRSKSIRSLISGYHILRLPRFSVYVSACVLSMETITEE